MPGPWSQDDDNELRRLYRANPGLSAPDLANLMSPPRRWAVVERKARALGILLPISSKIQEPEPPEEVTGELFGGGQVGPYPPKTEEKPEQPAEPARRVRPLLKLAMSGAAEAVDLLRPMDCRWPIGEVQEPSFRFCCLPRADATTFYCLEHLAASRSRGAKKVGSWQTWGRRKR